MSELILHHFDASPFAEKIRVLFAIKKLSWYSVDIPMVMPKPDLTALTGGYRKTPALQIGAEIYVDTACIADELEKRFPEVSIYPDGSQGLCKALAFWSNNSFFQPGAGLSMGVNELVPEEVKTDRFAFFNFMDFSILEEEIPYLYDQFLAHANLVEQQLQDDRQFVLGDAVSWADVNAWFVFWMARANIPTIAEYFEPLLKAQAWEERMGSFGNGDRKEMSPTEAHSIARNTDADVGCGITCIAQALAADMEVDVFAEDYGKDRIRGKLITHSLDRISINRDDPVAGNVNVHFPRTGFRVVRV